MAMSPPPFSLLEFLSNQQFLKVEICGHVGGRDGVGCETYKN